jgi:hypothetical protein
VYATIQEYEFKCDKYKMNQQSLFVTPLENLDGASNSVHVIDFKPRRLRWGFLSNGVK